MKHRIDTFRRDGLAFDVLDEGPIDGEVVVLLHGFPQLNTSWAKVTPLLHDAGYRTIAPNQRGYSPGARPKGRRAYRITELVADLCALVDVIGVPVHLVGHDWGAAVSWAAVSRRPDLFRSHVAISVPHLGAFVAAMPRGQAVRSWYMGVFNIPGVPERLMASGRAKGLMAGHFGMPADALAAFEADFDVERLRGGLAWYRALVFESPRRLFAHAQVPTTYLWSTADAALGRAAATLTEKYVDADYRFEILNGASHWLPDEQPEVIADAIIDRVKSV